MEVIMKFSQLPQSLRDTWESMTLDEQTAFVSCLARNKKKARYSIKAKAEVNVVAPIIHYIGKHKIPHEVIRKGKHVVFYFDGLQVRNQVLIGKNTI
jgi:hypothetical protein